VHATTEPIVLIANAIFVLIPNAAQHYDVLTQRWKDGDFSEHLSVVRHPGDDLYNYLRRSFTRLKAEQARELKATQGK